MKTEFITNKELLVFIALQKLGKSLVSEIARETLVNRTALYHTLSLLIKKGLGNEIKADKIAYYEALSLEEYKLWEKRKVDEMQKSLHQIESIISNNSKEDKTLRSKFKYYEGIEAIKNLYNETWRDNPKKEIQISTERYGVNGMVWVK